MTTLLMIDDEELFLKSMSRYFEGRGYCVVAERNAETALERFLQTPEAFDVVILDHDMPGMSGRECLRRMIERRPNLPVFVMSGYPPECFQPGDYDQARAILAKPMDLADVEHAVRTAL